MPKFFISYRRADTKASSGRIYDRLAAAFGKDNIFMDVDDIPPGVDFRSFLQAEIRKADVVLVIIGPNWASILKERRNNPDDFVRIELESALTLRKLTIPVLVEGATAPSPSDVPQSLSNTFPYLNAATLGDNPTFHRDMTRLIDRLAKETNSKPLKDGITHEPLESIDELRDSPIKTLLQTYQTEFKDVFRSLNEVHVTLGQYKSGDPFSSEDPFSEETEESYAIKDGSGEEKYRFLIDLEAKIDKALKHFGKVQNDLKKNKKTNYFARELKQIPQTVDDLRILLAPEINSAQIQKRKERRKKSAYLFLANSMLFLELFIPLVAFGLHTVRLVNYSTAFPFINEIFLDTVFWIITLLFVVSYAMIGAIYIGLWIRLKQVLLSVIIGIWLPISFALGFIMPIIFDINRICLVIYFILISISCMVAVSLTWRGLTYKNIVSSEYRFLISSAPRNIYWGMTLGFSISLWGNTYSSVLNHYKLNNITSIIAPEILGSISGAIVWVCILIFTSLFAFMLEIVFLDSRTGVLIPEDLLPYDKQEASKVGFSFSRGLTYFIFIQVTLLFLYLVGGWQLLPRY